MLGLVVCTIVAFSLKPQFKSTASVFAAEKADLFGALEGVSSLVRSFSPRSLANLGGNPEVDRYMAILKSGKVLGEVVKEFNLTDIYGFKSATFRNERTVNKLLSNVEFVAEPEGNLTITVYDEDPQRAADMANFFVELLNRTNSDLQSQNARGNRKFIGERYDKNLSDLTAAEDSLRAFQKRYGVVAMPQQAEASLKMGVELEAQLAAKEIQLGILRKTQALDNPSVATTQLEISEIRKKLGEMNAGGNGLGENDGVFVPFKRIPDLATEYLRRFRDTEIQYKILQFLTPLYEQAKVEERRETPSVIVLDRASPAERKSRPKRLTIILGGMLVGFVASLGYVAVAERWRVEKGRQSPIYASASNLFRSIKSDLAFKKRTRR